MQEEKKYIYPWKKEYAKDLAVALSNEKTLDNLRDGLPYPYTESDALSFIHTMLQSDRSDVFAFAVVKDGKCIGSIAAFRGQNIHYRTAEIGYYLSEIYWGRGIMTEAVGELCDYVFKNTDIVRLYAEPFSDNAASCRVLEKNNFTLEGTLRNNAFKKGKLRDMKMYAKIKEDTHVRN